MFFFKSVFDLFLSKHCQETFKPSREILRTA